MQKHIWIAILLAIFGLFFGSRQALAIDVPNFPTCSNPQGTIKISYPDGTHGIVGDSNQYTGKDTVYQLDNGNLSQCFCSASGQGIQTNWWKISSLDSEQIQILKNDGWFYIPNGALWGLEEIPYMAINSNYSCLPEKTNENGGGSGGSDGRSDGRSDGLGCGSNDCSNQQKITQAVLGASTDVLGLAPAGGKSLPFALAIIGIATLVFGLILNRKSPQK